MICYRCRYHGESTISLISPLVTSKDGDNFAALELRKKLRCYHSLESFRTTERQFVFIFAAASRAISRWVSIFLLKAKDIHFLSQFKVFINFLAGAIVYGISICRYLRKCFALRCVNFRGKRTVIKRQFHFTFFFKKL